MTTGKITLITPPDFYENSNPSILLIGLNESEQDESSQWLGQELQLDTDINLYYYQNETHIEWLLYAVARSNAVYVNADTDNPIIQTFLSYMLGKSNVYFSSTDPDKVKLFSFINGHRVNNITEFLQGVFSD